jgi:AcrR family transcriptional regulator
MIPSGPTQAPGDAASTDTKALLVESAVETLKARGFAGASAREIAKTGRFNQALIFYHFGSVQNLLLAGLDSVSERRLHAYRPAFARANTVADFAALARDIYREDLENGYVTVLGEMVAGGVSDPELGREVVARILPWIDLVDGKVRALTAGSSLEPMIPARDVAFAIIALYLGIDMLSHLDGDHTRSEALLDVAMDAAPLAQALLASESRRAG